MSIRIGSIDLGTVYKSKPNPQITINQKPNQTIVAEVERYWEKETYNNSFEMIPVNLKNKLHVYAHGNTGYAHGQLSFTPNTFVNGGELTSDLTINVTDATSIPVSIPEGYEDYYFYNSKTKFYEDTNYDNYIENAYLTGKVIFFDLNGYLLTNHVLDQLFHNTQLTHLNLSNLDITGCTNMTNFFSSSPNLQYIEGLENLNTSEVTEMQGTFGNVKATSLNISGWDTSKLQNMSYMFSGCSVTSLNLTNWNVSKLNRMENAFYGSGLTSLDLSKWNTPCLTRCDNLIGSTQIQVLDVSNFDTTKVTYSHAMFMNSNLRYLIIGSPVFKFPLPSSYIGVNSSCKILVPQSLISTYQNETNWSQHANQFEPIENYTITRSNGQVTVTPNNA